LSPADIGAATTSHTHGNITSAGAIGSTSGIPIITSANGVLRAGSFGTTIGTFCEGNDSRFTSLQTAIDGKLDAYGGSCVICGPNDNLESKYAQAKAITGISESNRICLIVFPGLYSRLNIDTEFVDVVGLGATVKTPAVFIINLAVKANNIRVSGIGTPPWLNRQFGAENHSLQVFENCSGGSYSWFWARTVNGETDLNTWGSSGTFINCVAGEHSFGLQGSSSGSYTNCSGGWSGAFKGKYISCTFSGVPSLTAPTTGKAVMINCDDGNGNILEGQAPL
jgi:hypothetical protein